MKKQKADRDIQYSFFGKGGEHCGICSMFVKPCHCTLVAGIISDKGWCRAYEARVAGVPRRSNQT